MIHTEVCFPHDCKPTMDWLCGDWIGKAVPGSNLVKSYVKSSTQHLEMNWQHGFLDACQLCALRQIFSKPPIQVV